MILVAGTIWLTVLGPLGGKTGWYTLGAILVVLALTRFADPVIRGFSRWVLGRRSRRGGGNA